jgi:DNA invertase Pin-like site-specific DNA recombinase
MAGFIAYYRVSTDRQGRSGLGLDAQRQAVAQFVGAGQLAAEFTEIESGKRHHNRPQLAAALAECKKRRLTLVIAKLDRLARNVHFISGLMESSADFVAVDMPQANRLTIHILAAVAEHEREMISQRTKAALAQARRRGRVLGNPRLEEARRVAASVNRTNSPAPPVLALMSDMRAQGKTWRAIADTLNGSSVRTGRGQIWYGSTVRTTLNRAVNL